jgi:hypothetical protein
MYSIQEPVRRKTREDDFEIRPTIVHQVLVEKFTSDIVGNSGGPSVSRFFSGFSVEVVVKGMP